MNIAIVGINNSLIDLSSQNEVIDFIKFNIHKQGKSPSLISYFPNNIDNLRHTMQQGYDILFVVGTDSIIFNHNLKDNLARILSVKLEKNTICESMLMEYCSNRKIVYSSQEEMQTEFPLNAQVICKKDYFNNAFTYKYNSTLIIMLPADIDFVKEIYQTNILPFVIDNNTDSELYETMTIRCYGLLQKDLKSLLADELSNPNLSINIVSKRLDNAIHIKYKNSNISFVQPIIADICSKLSQLIYATEDTTLYETAVNLLTIQNKKIVIGETITAGNITRNILKHGCDVLEKGITVTTFDTMAKQLKLNERVVNQFGKYSVNTVYELGNLLLELSTAEISIMVLGSQDIDTCYMAIGDIDGIHVYKNKVQSLDNTSIEMLSETTMYYLIKKLRQNDLQFR